MKHFILQMLPLSLLFSFSLLAQPVDHRRLIYSHPLTSAAPGYGEAIYNTDGEFDAVKGWQAVHTTSQLQIHLAKPLPAEGTLAIRVTNFNPAEQWVDDLKLHIVNLYSRLYTNNKEIFDTDGSWIQIRTGSGYSTMPGRAGFKVLAAARGIGTRDEVTCVEDYLWKTSRIYEFRITWTRGRVYLFLDNNLMAELSFLGQIEPFKYILIGKDNLIWGYCAQPGPWYFDLRIYEKGEAVVEDRVPPAAPAQVTVRPLAEVR